MRGLGGGGGLTEKEARTRWYAEVASPHDTHDVNIMLDGDHFGNVA